MSDSTPYPLTCPKCSHVRTGMEAAPDWQCPACGIAYNKYQAWLGRKKKLMTPPGAADTAPHWTDDGSILTLVIANVLSLAVALYQDWSTVSLMLLYWGQSVIIGIANVFRMLALDRFSTQNFTMNGRHVEPTTGTKIQVACFFAVHYGFFHLVYLFFLIDFAGDAQNDGMVTTETGFFDPWFLVCMAVFALNHFWSYRYNRDIDRRGTPNIGTLMFTPYLRIVPMHLTIIFGGMFMNTGASLLLFGGLKTLADVLMHMAEHAQLTRLRSAKIRGRPRY